MILRRYYKMGQKYKRTYTDEYVDEMKEKLGDEEASNIDNAEYEIVLESLEEQKSWFFDGCRRVMENPRWYLDNLDKIPTFRVKITEIFPEKTKDL
jgi:uncharacterized protein YdiU (UPF0061 family)